MTRRCPSSPNHGSSEPTNRQTGSLPHRIRRGYYRNRRRRRADRSPPDPSLPDPAVVERAKAIRRFPGSHKSRARRPSSKEHRRRRGTAPTPNSAPAAPPPPRRRRTDTHQTLAYVQAVERASPTLPPPKRPTERGEPTPHRLRGGFDGGLSKNRRSGL